MCASRALPSDAASIVLDRCWRIAELDDVSALVDATVPAVTTRMNRSNASNRLERLERFERFERFERSERSRPSCCSRPSGRVAGGRARRTKFGFLAVLAASGFCRLLVMEKHRLIEKHAAEAGIADLTVRWVDLGGPSVVNDACCRVRRTTPRPGRPRC